jgi:hypothetical protein
MGTETGHGTMRHTKGNMTALPMTMTKPVEGNQRFNILATLAMVIATKIIIVVLLLIMKMSATQNITISAWNMRSLRGAAPYVNELMKEADILFLSEHRLHKCELYKLESLNRSFMYHSKASQDLDNTVMIRQPGHCGVAMCWKKEINHQIRVIDNHSDRVCIIEVISCLCSTNFYLLICIVAYKVMQIQSDY